MTVINGIKMNRKTFLSSHFPDVVTKWNKYFCKLKEVNSWYISSDYCLDDKDKPNDVMTFTIFPFDHPYTIRDGIKQYLPKDIKDFKNLSEKALNYIKTFPYFFSMAFIIEHKNDMFKLEENKSLLNDVIKHMENWPKPKKEEFIHKMKKFRSYLNRKDVDLKTLSDMAITSNIMSFIIEFLMIKANAKHIMWISDRDRITDFQDGIVSEFVRLGYANLVNNRVPDKEVYGFWGGKEYDKKIFDEFVRIPDYISGALAAIDFEDSNNIPEKHYKLFDKGIIDNDRICIMHIDHGKDADTWSELNIGRMSL